MASKIKINCMKCGKEMKLDFKSIKSICKKCKKTFEKNLIYDPYFLPD